MALGGYTGASTTTWLQWRSVAICLAASVARSRGPLASPEGQRINSEPDGLGERVDQQHRVDRADDGPEDGVHLDLAGGPVARGKMAVVCLPPNSQALLLFYVA